MEFQKLVFPEGLTRAGYLLDADRYKKYHAATILSVSIIIMTLAVGFFLAYVFSGVLNVVISGGIIYVAVQAAINLSIKIRKRAVDDAKPLTGEALLACKESQGLIRKALAPAAATETPKWRWMDLPAVILALILVTFPTLMMFDQAMWDNSKPWPIESQIWMLFGLPGLIAIIWLVQKYCQRPFTSFLSVETQNSLLGLAIGLSFSLPFYIMKLKHGGVH